MLHLKKLNAPTCNVTGCNKRCAVMRVNVHGYTYYAMCNKHVLELKALHDIEDAAAKYE